jgi:hypothetical protein
MFVKKRGATEKERDERKKMEKIKVIPGRKERRD